MGKTNLKSTIPKAPDTNIAQTLIEFDELSIALLGQSIISQTLIAMTAQGTNHILPKLVNKLDSLDLLVVCRAVLSLEIVAESDS